MAKPNPPAVSNTADGPQQFQQRHRRDGTCPGRPNACITFFAGDADSIHPEITGARGSNLGLGDLDDVRRANILCNEPGLDPVALGFTLSMVMRAASTPGPTSALAMLLPFRR